MNAVRLRCDLHVNGENRKLILAADREETLEHLALKLSAFLLFWDADPIVAPSVQHPALSNQEFRPDLVALDLSGAVALWVECGTVTIHKMNKLVKRYPSARLVVIKASEHDGRRLREDLSDKVDRSDRVEILAWKASDFAVWLRAMAEKTEAIGEAGGASLNLVVNETPVASDLVPF